MATFDIIILSCDSLIMSPLCYSNPDFDDLSSNLIVQTSGKSWGKKLKHYRIDGVEWRDPEIGSPDFKSASGSWSGIVDILDQP